MDEDLEKGVIEELSVVSSVCFHTGDKTHKGDFYANLRCCGASSYGDCGAKLVGPIHMSSEHPTPVDCLRELGRVMQRDRRPPCITASQESQAPKKYAAEAFIEQRAAQTNKATLETDKARDKLHNQIEQIVQRMLPKRTHTHDDAGDVHEML